MNNAVLIQQADGPHAAFLRLTQPYHAAYCARHNFDYWCIVGRVASQEDKSAWQRVDLIKQAFNAGYETIVWLDADTLIVSETDLREAVPQSGTGIGCTWHARDWTALNAICTGEHRCYDHFNTGALYIGFNYRTEAFIWNWAGTPDAGHFWNDQHAFNLQVEDWPLCHNETAPCPVEKIDHRWNSTLTWNDFRAEEPVVLAWHGFGDPAERLAAMQQAVRDFFHRDLYAEALAAHRAGRHAESEALLTTLIEQESGRADAHVLLSSALAQQNKYQAAEEQARLALGFAPRDQECWRMYAGILSYLGREAEAAAANERAYEIEPNAPWIRHNRALHRLRAGDYPAAWKELDWWFKTGQRTMRTVGQYWDGGYSIYFNSSTGHEIRKLYVWAEDGLGDTIMLARFISVLKMRYPNLEIYWEVQPALVSLFADSPDAALVFANLADAPAPIEFDYHVGMLSLPGILGVTLDDLMAEPYLFCHDPAPIESDKFKVGIAWKGNPGHPNDFARSLTFEQMQEIAGGVDCHLVCLQPEATEQERQYFDSAPRFTDMASTARWVAACDLVVTVDTAVAHLAAAMGKPVWILLPFAADHRWFMDREDSPWYGSARLFRQTEWLEWGDVMERVNKELDREARLSDFMEVKEKLEALGPVKHLSKPPHDKAMKIAVDTK